MRVPSERYDGPAQYDVEGNYARLQALYDAHPFRTEERCVQHNEALVISILKPYELKPSVQLLSLLCTMLYALYHYEGLYEVHAPSKYEADLRLKDQLYQTHAERLVLADNAIRSFFERFFRRVKPSQAFAEPAKRSVYLIELCDSPADVVNDIVSLAYCDAFPKTNGDMFNNLARVSGLNHRDLPAKPKYVWPKDSELDPLQLSDAYLRDTPFASLLRLRVPFKIPERIRFEHTHVVAGTGHGKTTLLTEQFIEDVFDEKQPSVIVIDGKGTWAPALQRFKMFAPDRELSKRLIIINPQDPRPAALNMFSLPDRALVDSLSENLAYIFGSREFELSAKQRTAFTYAAQLIFSMEHPTIETLLALMRDPVLDPKRGGVPTTSIFWGGIDKLPPISKRFFQDLFYHPTEFLETKRQIQNRIYDLISCPAFATMFTQRENRLNMLDVMQSGKILIVDSSPGAVGEKAASSFGRYIISLALSTARSRINLPRTEWRPTYLYVDEAQLFVDEERTQPLLQQAREFNLGVLLSHQKLGDLSPTLRGTFAGNTVTKYCGHPSHDDARAMAKDMFTEVDFVHKQPRHSFALYSHGVTPRAIAFKTSLGPIEEIDQMSDAEYRDLMARNRSFMSPKPKATHDAPRVSAAVKPKPPEDAGGMTGSSW